MPTPIDDAACPCGRGIRFADCCGPALRGVPPVTAEALMRSRYTAFAVHDAAYLRESWHPGTRADVLDLEADLQWIGLDIVDTAQGGPDDKRGVVEFRARWRQGRETGELHERSRFVKQSGRWWYLDGEVN